MSNDRSHSNVMTVFAAVIALAEIGARLVPLLTHRSVATLFYCRKADVLMGPRFR